MTNGLPWVSPVRGRPFPWLSPNLASLDYAGAAPLAWHIVADSGLIDNSRRISLVMPHWSYSLLYASFISLGMWRTYSHFMNRSHDSRLTRLVPASMWDAATKWRGAG